MFEKEIDKLDKKENKLLNRTEKDNFLKNIIYEKVPKPLKTTLEFAFIKAFQTVFVYGTIIIEKTFSKEDINLEFEANNYILDKQKKHKMTG